MPALIVVNTFLFCCLYRITFEVQKLGCEVGAVFLVFFFCNKSSRGEKDLFFLNQSAC